METDEAMKRYRSAMAEHSPRANPDEPLSRAQTGPDDGFAIEDIKIQRFDGERWQLLDEEG